VAAYERDGVVCLRNAHSAAWLAVIEQGIDTALAGGSEDLDIVEKDGDSGRFSYSSQAWQQVAPFRQFIFESRVADLSWPFLDSKSLTLYYDFLLIKEPGTARAATPWHQDHAYYPLRGSDVINCWTALDRIPLETALRFWRGSHAQKVIYQAAEFSGESDYRHLQTDRPPPPEIDTDPTAEILATDMNPGDMLVWDSHTFHSAPGNTSSNRRAAFSVNWTGDGAVFHDMPSLGTYRDDGIHDGMPIAGDRFPTLRTRESALRRG
jgi:ectoine hydroxylase-related dioxygenase (phytanoyl-CoA dioxygenase family)